MPPTQAQTLSFIQTAEIRCDTCFFFVSRCRINDNAQLFQAPASAEGAFEGGGLALQGLEICSIAAQWLHHAQLDTSRRPPAL